MNKMEIARETFIAITATRMEFNEMIKSLITGGDEAPVITAQRLLERNDTGGSSSSSISKRTNKAYAPLTVYQV
jgi:hypothetical protein